MTGYPREITERLDGTSEQLVDALVRLPPRGWRTIAIEDYDPGWVDRYDLVSAGVREALGERVISIEHVGSTSVPGLAAKPIIDLDLTVADTSDESVWLPALERIGYTLVLREPWWHEHRMLVDDAEDVHLHVWPAGAAEPVRHRLFRDWLRAHPEDRELYASTKRRLAVEKPDDYTMAKSDVIDDIFSRVFGTSKEVTDAS